MATDDVVIVTGAGGNLGAAAVELLAARGSRLVAMDRTGSSLDRVLGHIESTERHLGVLGVDLGDPAACVALVEQALDRFGRIDGLVHTVGTFAMADIDLADPGHWQHLFAANLLTALNMCRAVVPAMRRVGRGSIVTIGAAGAARAGKGMAAYASSKSAVLRLTESVADELKGDGIRANCVLPSTIDTPQNRAAMPNADTSRWVTPAQIAEVIAFLLSDAGAAVNGAAVPVSGRG
jgi:NAD(P)-dependent dehydrogenase (short-subunit alcohol dehydrogenase family)